MKRVVIATYRFLAALIVASVVSFVSWNCTDSDTVDVSQPIQLVALASSNMVEVQTRTDCEHHSGYEYFTDTDYKIGVYFPPNRSNTLGVFEYDGTKWNTTTARVDPEVWYDIYGFMPVDKVTSSSVTNFTGTVPHSNVDNPVLHLNGISAVANQEISVVVGVGENEQSAKLGQFSYQGKDGTVGNENKLFLLMQRLYAQFEFQFAVDEVYSDLRTIKLKKLTFVSESYKEVSIDITFNSVSNTVHSKPIENVAFNRTSGTSNIDLFTDSNGEELPVETEQPWKIIPGFFTPSDEASTFKLKVEYDVYDKKDAVNPVRKNCKAENSWTLSKPEMGTKYVVKVLVKPTYLYQLSDNDLNNPGIVITTN